MRYIVVLGFLVAAILAYVAYWFWLADEVVAGVERWASERRAEGYEVDYGALEVSGFPYRLHISIDAPQIAAPAHPNAWRIGGEGFEAYVQPWNLGHVIVVSDRAFHASWREGPAFREATLTAEQARASLILDERGMIRRYVIEMTEGVVEFSDGATVEIDQGQIASRRSDTGGVGERGEALDLAVLLQGLTLPEQAREENPLGRQIERLEATGVLKPALDDTSPPAVATWRDEGGVLEVGMLILKWGPLDVRGNGVAALDDSFRPTGRLSTEIRGYEAILELLVRARRLKEGDATTARFALDLLANIDPDGRRFLQVPLVSEGGRLFLGPVPILMVPSIF